MSRLTFALPYYAFPISLFLLCMNFLWYPFLCFVNAGIAYRDNHPDYTIRLLAGDVPEIFAIVSI